MLWHYRRQIIKEAAFYYSVKVVQVANLTSYFLTLRLVITNSNNITRNYTYRYFINIAQPFENSDATTIHYTHKNMNIVFQETGRYNVNVHCPHNIVINLKIWSTSQKNLLTHDFNKHIGTWRYDVFSLKVETTSSISKRWRGAKFWTK